MTQQELQAALDYSIEKVRLSLETLNDFPERCEGDEWTTIQLYRLPLDRAHWVDGFWTGLIWLAYGHTGDAGLARIAREWTERLAWLRTSTGTHDLGFIFYLSHVLGARLTGDEALLPNAVEAAGTLIRRFNAKGEFLQAWGELNGPPQDRGRTNIDLMMNLALLFWASTHTGDVRYARVAARHARTSRLTMMRPDGSTSHVADFDPDTGAFIRQETYQGLSATSCWSRGQGWALHGFVDCYRRTGDEVFLAAARQLAAYTLANAPDDLVPFWDYNSPDIPNTPRDSSAAAVMASGLLDLAACESDGERAGRWREAAEAMTLSLWRNYSSRGTNRPAILLHATRSLPHGYADHGLIYGDYYFVETLTKLLRPDVAGRVFPAPERLSVT